MDRTGDPIVTNALIYAVHIMLSSKLGDHEGLTLFVHSRLLKSTLLVVLPTILIQNPIHMFLSPVPAHCQVQSGASGAAWQLLVGRQRPGTQLRETQCQFCVFCIIFLIISKAVLISNL